MVKRVERLNREWEAGAEMSKYNNRKTVVDGIVFDSKKEAEYYCELELRFRAGDILGYELQPEFILQEAFTDSMGTKHRAIKYRADFRIMHTVHVQEVVDVKGVKTKEYQLKKKLFLAKYPQYKFTEVP